MFAEMTVGKKLTLAFGSLGFMMLFGSGLAIKLLDDADKTFTQYVTGIDARAAVSAKVRASVDKRAIAARNLVLVTKVADLDVEKSAVASAQAEVKASLDELLAMVAKAPDVDEKTRALINEIASVERSYGPVATAIVELALAGKHDAAIAKMNDECRPLLTALVAASSAYADYNSGRAEQLARAATEQFAKQRAFLIVACAVALCLAIGASVLIVRGLTSELGAEPANLRRAAERVAGGDLGPVAGAQEAPAGSVLASLASMQVRLAELVSVVRGASASIAAGSEEIAKGNQDLSRRTEDQASALQQTAATMDELSSTVTHNSESAAQANQLALGASAVATKGGTVVGQVVEKMKGMSESSNRISDITSLIDGIAFQTNILALNAAVEAARAGEQGRGFAVVASEVRSLARRSSEAAREIKALITETVEQVEQGTALADRAGATMLEIVGAIKRVSDMVGEISAASAQQSSGVAQVGQAVARMDGVTQQNAALVEQSAAASETLKQQSLQLVESMSVFKLDH